MTLISVVVPSYNQGNFIQRTLTSIYQQSEIDFDCYVADGGSRDETQNILQATADRYQNFKWHSHPDLGQADAVNQAIEQTSGEIIAWINSDDLYYPGALAAVHQVFDDNPRLQVIYGLANYIDETDQVLAPYPTQPWNYQHLKDICYLCQPAVFFRRSCIEAWGSLNLNLKYCLDYELWLRWGKQTDFYFLPQVLAGSRQYLTNKTQADRLTAHAELNQMLHQQLGYVPDRHLINYARVKTEHLLKLKPKDSIVILHNRPISKTPGFWFLLLRELIKQYGAWKQFPNFGKLIAFFWLKSSLLLR